MADKAPNVKAIPQFPGYGTNRDPHDSPEVAIDVTNVTFHEPGKLPCRKGSKPLAFTNKKTTLSDGTVDSEFNVESAFPYKKAGVFYVIHQDSNGNVRTGRIN
tara:strand:+ start:72 stop:380 length:309 start_codon:yes stop_codon:yes gene_type:complete